METTNDNLIDKQLYISMQKGNKKAVSYTHLLPPYISFSYCFFYKIGREKKQKIITILPPSYIEMFIIY